MITESVQSILARQEINQEAAAGTSSNIVDKDGFFKLLIAQMKHQDPFEPMENAEMMSQMAQFSTLEQLQNINSKEEAKIFPGSGTPDVNYNHASLHSKAGTNGIITQIQTWINLP